MKKAIFTCAGVFILLVLIPFPARAGDYHIKGENLFCSDCHTIHFSEDGKVPDTPRAWGTSPQEHLLKDVTSQMCLMCHDGEHPLAPDVLHATSRINAAGYFGDDPNTVFGHTLNISDRPPGYKGTWDKTLTCTSCHDPHGNTYYRNIRLKPGVVSSDLPVTYFPSPSNQNEGAVEQVSKDPPDHYGADNIIYRQESLSDWCSGCHTDYNHGENGSSPWSRHPAKGINMMDADNVNLDFWLSDLDFRPPTVRPLLGDPENHEEDRPFCGSCHKAHGSSHPYGLLLDSPETVEPEGGQYVRDTCQACHNIGRGNYESSPHGDTSHGVYHDKSKGFARGECEHCHQQHGDEGEGGYEHNLFTENDNFLCLTAGCHLEQPFEMNNVPGGAVRIPCREGLEFQGYFETNEEGVRIPGLEYRVRWPGADYYQDTHGFCTNCHSPHGTDNPFDMLKRPYLGIVNSDNFDEEPPYNYQLCFSCHNNQTGPQGMQPQKVWADEGARFIADYYNQSVNNDGFSGHQIRKSPGSASEWPSYVKGGEKLACSNCHNPHGSRGYNGDGRENKYLLSDERRGWSGLDTLNDPNSSRRFCFGCHVPSDVDPSVWGDGNPPEVEGIKMASIPFLSAHEAGSRESCHNCHGADYSTDTSDNVHHPSAGSCDGCHADQGIMAKQPVNTSRFTGPHAYHTDIDGSWVKWEEKGEPERTYAFACEMCHAKLNTGHGAAVHVNGRTLLAEDENASPGQYVEVSFHDNESDWVTQTIHKRSYRYISLYRNPYNGEEVTPRYLSAGYDEPLPDEVDKTGTITWTNQSGGQKDSCLNIWCHSNGDPLSLSLDPDGSGYRENSYRANVSSFTLTWDDHGGDRCNNCHGFTDILEQPEEERQYLSSLHRNHIGTTGKEKIRCGQCHAFTCISTSNTIRQDMPENAEGNGYFYHVNGKKEVVFSNLNPSGTYNYENHTCSDLYCHPGEVTWKSSATEGCAACHGVYAEDQDPHELCTAGYVHLAAKWGPHIQCNDCHSGPYYVKGEIDADNSSENELAAAGNPGWYNDMWKGSTLIITGPLLTKPIARFICGNTNDTLLFSESLPGPPSGTYAIVSPGSLTHCDGQVTYKDGVGALSQTRACDKCHSPRGDYDGVNHPAYGAKANWKTGVYTDYGEAGDTYKALKKGKEKWCVGCHDKEPAYSRSDESDTTGVRAPNVAGNEGKSTFYGKGYGYFRTGHGLDGYQNYPASEESGAGVSCTDCHDVDRFHIDHEQRTYVPGENNYRLGYRLRMVKMDDGTMVEPMDIPRTWYDGVPDNVWNDNPLRDWKDFALCFQCHDRYTLLGDPGREGEYYQDPLKTNFTNNGMNLHTRHLEGRFRGRNLDWTSGWTSTADSSISCPACHNVHGSPSPRMMRHGELISTTSTEGPTNDKVPALNFYYFTHFNQIPQAPKDITLIDSKGGEMFSQYKGGPGRVGTNKICNTCHRAWCWYFRLPDINPQILTVRAVNNPTGVQGIDDGDTLIISFNTATNGDEKIVNGETVQEYFRVYQDPNQKESTQRTWGTIREEDVQWTKDGGHENDTLTITMGREASITPGDQIEVVSGDLKDPNTGQSFLGASKVITGTFDCSVYGAYARVADGELQVIFKFLGATAANGIDTNNVDQALKLNNFHSWGKITSQWSNSAEGENDLLTITLLEGATIDIGDSITLTGIITDAEGNPIFGAFQLQGSFDPPVWHKPQQVYDYSAQGPPGFEVIKSIDGNFTTYWHPAGQEGWVVFDLLAEYQISQIRIYSGDYPGEDQKALVTIWVSRDSSFNDLPQISEWEALIETGWQESPGFDSPKNGRYLKIQGSKIGAGPLTHFFSEIEFEGVGAPLPP